MKVEQFCCRTDRVFPLTVHGLGVPHGPFNNKWYIGYPKPLDDDTFGLDTNDTQSRGTERLFPMSFMLRT